MIDKDKRISKARKQRFKLAVRNKDQRPVLKVFRSLKHVYAQVIHRGKVVTCANTLQSQVKNMISSYKLKAKESKNFIASVVVGKAIAASCLSKNITKVVFDRSGFVFIGRIKTLAESVMANGISF